MVTDAVSVASVFTFATSDDEVCIDAVAADVVVDAGVSEESSRQSIFTFGKNE